MTPITEEKERLADLRSLTIIGQPVDELSHSHKHLLYKFKTCGHLQNIETNLVRLGKFKCRSCEHEKLVKEADTVNLILIERASKGVNALYEFKECGHTQRIGYSAVKDNLFRCRSCYYSDGSMIDKATKYATLCNLSFLEKVDAALGLYRREDCGHTFEYQISAVKAAVKAGSKVHCPVCKEDNLTTLLKNNEVSLVSKEKSSVTYKYGCGHTNTQDHYLIARSGVVDCPECKLKDTIDTAEKKGLKPVNLLALNSAGSGRYKFIGCDHDVHIDRREILLRDTVPCTECRNSSDIAVIDRMGVSIVSFSSDRRKFVGTFNSCGHTRTFETYLTVHRSKTLTCFECTTSKHLSEAQDADLTLLGKASNNDPNYRRYRTSCCGHETDFEVTHVRRKSFNCPNCSEDRYSKESNLYVVKISINEDSWLKVGIAKDVGVRVQGYGLPNGSHVETILVKPFKTGREAIKVEKALHKTLKGIRECSTKMKEILTTSGFTECYSIDHYKTIMKHIEELNL